MPISGSFGRFTAVQQPYTGTPNNVGPDPDHGAVKGTMTYGTRNAQALGAPTGPQQPFIGDNVNTKGNGIPGAQSVEPRMAARGFMRDFSRFSDQPSAQIPSFSGHFTNTAVQTGSGPGPVAGTTGYPGRGVQDKTGPWAGVVDHHGTAVLRRALGAPTLTSGSETNGVIQAGLNGVSGAAHSDMRTARIAGHEYSPIQAITQGESFTVDRVGVKGTGDTISGRAIVKGTIGGTFVDGTDQADYTPVYGDKVGASVQRRWAQARYSSSATLTAGNSRHTLRGVLPNTIATPYPQPGITGGVLNKNSGIAPNARNLHLPFTVPQLFRLPSSMADNVTVVNDGSAGGSNLGIGF